VLAGGIAHDFNNILTPIIGHSEIVLLDLEEDHVVRKDISTIYGSAIRAKNLVKQILTFSRQEKEEIKPLRLQPIITDAIKMLRSSIPANIEKIPGYPCVT